MLTRPLTTGDGLLLDIPYRPPRHCRAHILDSAAWTVRDGFLEQGQGRLPARLSAAEILGGRLRLPTRARPRRLHRLREGIPTCLDRTIGSCCRLTVSARSLPRASPSSPTALVRAPP